MLCKIADLITDVPEAGGLAPRLRDYQWTGAQTPDIIIREDEYRSNMWKGYPRDFCCYMESGFLFYARLLCFQGMMLHASAVVYDGRAYLFSGSSGVGKSTHARLWQKMLGEDRAVVINDDKPALRRMNGRWYAYGTPWCGKDGINANQRAPLAGICFLEQGEENRISILDPKDAVPKLISQTMHWFYKPEKVYLMLDNLQKLLDVIPTYHFVNRPEPEAARISFDIMRREAEKRNL
jgi:hypothetical protein